MGPHAGEIIRLQHIYHGQPYARVDLNPMPELTLSPSHGLWIWPLKWLELQEELIKCGFIKAIVSSGGLL
jgi:hypothetical protein